MIELLIPGFILILGLVLCALSLLPWIGKTEVRFVEVRIEVSSDIYAVLSQNLKGAAAVAGQIAHIIPPHLADRLRLCIDNSQWAVGRMILEKEDPHVGAESGAEAVTGQSGKRGG